VNLLSLHGFDNDISLAGLTDEYIAAIERDSRDQSFVDMVKEMDRDANLTKYYGPMFGRNPQAFKLLTGA